MNNFYRLNSETGETVSEGNASLQHSVELRVASCFKIQGEQLIRQETPQREISRVMQERKLSENRHLHPTPTARFLLLSHKSYPLALNCLNTCYNLNITITKCMGKNLS